MIADFYRPYTCKEVAWMALILGVLSVALTWTLVFMGCYIAALIVSTIGNIHTWSSYAELLRRQRNGR